MRFFYVVWFFFCAGWGYLIADFPESDAPPWGQVVGSFPLALLTFGGLYWLELRRLLPGQLAQPPSLKLKPWNRPTGLMLFIGLTFVFASLWGVVIAAIGDLPGLRIAVNFLMLGAGAVVAIFACRRIFPARFDA